MCLWCLKRPRREGGTGCWECSKKYQLGECKASQARCGKQPKKPWYWNAEVVLTWRGVWLMQPIGGGAVRRVFTRVKVPKHGHLKTRLGELRVINLDVFDPLLTPDCVKRYKKYFRRLSRPEELVAA